MTTPVTTPEDNAVTPANSMPTKGDRYQSADPASFPVPHGKDEDWRFTPLRRLRGLEDTSAGKAAPAARTKISVDTGDQDGVSYSELAMDDERTGRAGLPVDRPAAEAWVNSPVADHVLVAKDTVLAEPVTVTVTGSGDEVTTYGTTVIELEPHAEAIVVLRYQGEGAHSDNLEFVVGDGARLTTVVWEDWGRTAVHLSNSHILVGRDATVRHTVATFGGDVVRSVPHVRFTGPGGDAELLGVSFADAGQYFEQRLLVDHSEPNCRSNVLYKSALQGETGRHGSEARTVWIGDVLIRPEATGTDTYETNKNLVLTEGARADAVPNLEIQTGEIVGAGHAATVGRFDDEHMFYLMSRGIPDDEARRLIIRGFFTDVIRRVPVDGVRENLEDVVEQELANTVL
ncbi:MULTISPECIES: Fe-S cluster assembly protein SufD [unclassified Corynebacterium]|uniref:Fe-S cluster assembly protein SufD n=1 Tax=unclassified Corynebacterium TaxID=2624378 RepID=UPI0026498912|nr:Fe-S cluster assembly protein SufD [Corynebacterium sp.]MDN5580988.1 Fe-S cluster assembly protein SufD [Corynebacterium sp.]MDN5719613.1 Fe-S cluster assembly protein SufD [Corynebacterium sp.]MDN6259311.1 Fe-S cluster assembly protein SufD [Corynebacterium sp.]